MSFGRISWATAPQGSLSPVRYVYGVGLVSSVDGVGQGQVRYYLPDALGSTRAALTGAVVQAEYSFESFGLPRGGESTKDTFMFAGQQSDSRSRQNSTGLYYLRNRYYDPSLGRFLTADPAKAGHPYAYADNNPVNRVDPTGLASEGGGAGLTISTSYLLDLLSSTNCVRSAIGLFISLAMVVFLLSPPVGGGLINPVNIQVAGFFGAAAIISGFGVIQNCDFG